MPDTDQTPLSAPGEVNPALPGDSDFPGQSPTEEPSPREDVVEPGETPVEAPGEMPDEAPAQSPDTIEVPGVMPPPD